MASIIHIGSNFFYVPCVLNDTPVTWCTRSIQKFISTSTINYYMAKTTSIRTCVHTYSRKKKNKKKQ